MVYVALLRGINVGGNRKVDMKLLKATFERIGMEEVRTYINSGNVIFQNSLLKTRQLANLLEKAIEADFGFRVPVLLRDINNIEIIVKALPDAWVNDNTMKCDVMFLMEAVATPGVMRRLTIKTDIENVNYVDGAILWRVDRSNVTRSGMMKLVGTELYSQMTIRNCNTVRKLLGLMEHTSD